MRQVVLDTETTGLEIAEGHRIIEIGAVEVVDRRLTGRSFHQYLNPEREIEDGALEVHGITREFLSDKPRFAEIAGDFLSFVNNAELVIHNAEFDLGFLDYELSMADPGLQPLSSQCAVVDTLELARELHPGQRNNLDALARRYEIDNSHRTLHGALLDAEILADVYLAMTGGQVDLALGFEFSDTTAEEQKIPGLESHRPHVVIRASEEEVAAHRAKLESICSSAGQCLWRELDDGSPAGEGRS